MFMLIDQPPIIAAIVSAVVAIFILDLKEFFIEPRRSKKNIQISHLEKQLQVYGALVTILRSCKRKALRKTDIAHDVKGKKTKLRCQFHMLAKGQINIY